MVNELTLTVPRSHFGDHQLQEVPLGLQIGTEQQSPTPAILFYCKTAPPCSKSMHLHSFIETWDPACFFVLARLQSWTCQKWIWCLLATKRPYLRNGRSWFHRCKLHVDLAMIKLSVKTCIFLNYSAAKGQIIFYFLDYGSANHDFQKSWINYQK
jgi:hypothetical protein